MVVHYPFNGTLGTCVSLMEAKVSQLKLRVIFSGFCNFLFFMSAEILVGVQNPPKITLHCNWRRSASISATQAPKVPFKRYWLKV